MAQGQFAVIDVLKVFWPLIVFQYGLAIWALVDISKRNKVRYLPKAAWVLIILFIHLLGPIGYFVLGREN